MNYIVSHSYIVVSWSYLEIDELQRMGCWVHKQCISYQNHGWKENTKLITVEFFIIKLSMVFISSQARQDNKAKVSANGNGWKCSRPNPIIGFCHSPLNFRALRILPHTREHMLECAPGRHTRMPTREWQKSNYLKKSFDTTLSRSRYMDQTYWAADSPGECDDLAGIFVLWHLRRAADTLSSIWALYVSCRHFPTPV